jgi:hypothetical protein
VCDVKLRCCDCVETSHIWVGNILEQIIYILASSRSKYTPSSISSTLPIHSFSVTGPISNNQAVSTMARLNILPMTPYTFRSTLTTVPRSQFDSPTFNSAPYHQPSANTFSFSMPAAHLPAVHFTPTPQFQAVQTSWAYSYTPVQVYYHTSLHPILCLHITTLQVHIETMQTCNWKGAQS